MYLMLSVHVVCILYMSEVYCFQYTYMSEVYCFHMELNTIVHIVTYIVQFTHCALNYTLCPLYNTVYIIFSYYLYIYKERQHLFHVLYNNIDILLFVILMIDQADPLHYKRIYYNINYILI